MRKDWIKYKPNDWSLKNFKLIEYAAKALQDKELILEPYADMNVEKFIKLNN